MKGSHRVIKFLIAALLTVFLVYQLYASVYRPVTTASVQYGEMIDGININAVIIREETLVDYNGGGVLHFNVEGGYRVEKNGIIAGVYSGEADSVSASRINELDKQIDSITQLQSYNAISATDLDLLNAKLETALDTVKLSCAYGNYDDTQQSSDDMMMILNRRQMVTGTATDFSAQLETLRAERDRLKTALPSPQAYIRAAQSGYFIDTVDGYETVLTPESIDTLTPEQLNSAEQQPVSSTAIGKLVSDYKWYIAAAVTVNQSLSYKEGDSLSLKTNLKSNPLLPVTVEKINISGLEDSAVIIFACQEMSSELASMRNGAMTIVSGTYTGLKVDRKALRYVNSTSGVYVLSGMELKYVPVEILYSGESYILCKMNTGTSGALKLYDEVVVKGKNLYDGKLIS